MKISLSSLLLSFLFILCACGNRSNRNAQMANNHRSEMEEQPEAGSLLVGTDQEQMNNLYNVMTEIPLPFVYNPNFILQAPGFIALPQNMQGLFHNFDRFDSNTKIARLPEKGAFKPLVILYQDEQGMDRMNLYTLSDSMKVIDRLQIYSMEKIEGNEVTILQDFAITEDYQIMLRKSLNDRVIEQLYYTLDDRRCFVERRDGLTPVIAFESPDNRHYVIETFVWEHNAQGGIYKKDLTQVYYKIDGDRKLEEITQSEYNEFL